MVVRAQSPLLLPLDYLVVTLRHFLVLSVRGVHCVLAISLNLETAISLAEHSLIAFRSLPVSNEQLQLSFLSFLGLQLRLTHAALQLRVVALLSGFLLLLTFLFRLLLLPLLEVALACLLLFLRLLVKQGLAHVFAKTDSELNV